MKRLPARFLVASILSALPFVACDDDTKGSSNDGGTDSTVPGVDGSMPANDAGLPDNYVPQADSGHDAGQDAGPPSATVVVTKGGAPDVGVTVVFQDAAGTLVGSAVTGADGKASYPVVAGSQITVALGAAGSRQLITYVGVKPGDVINVAEKVTRDVSITQTVFAMGGGDSIVVGNYNCSTNALSTGSPVLISATPDCITGATFPVISQLNYQGSSYYSFKKGNALAAVGTTNVTGLSAWAAGTTFTLNVTNAPNMNGATAILGQIANNQTYATTANNPILITAGAGSTTFTVATGYPDAFQGEVQYTNFIVGGYQQTVTFAKRIANGVATQTLDLGAGLLPGLTATSTAQPGARPIISWTAAGSLAGADSGVVDLSFTQPVDGGGVENVDWTFIVPPGTLTVTAPQLPAQLAAFTPSNASALGTPLVAFFESDLIASYDVVRQQAGALGVSRVPLGAFSNVQSPALPAPGTLRITAIAPGG